jgi:hypothetical protein
MRRLSLASIKLELGRSHQVFHPRHLKTRLDLIGETLLSLQSSYVYAPQLQLSEF